MPVVGKLDPFDPSTSEWAEYRERAELYFIANDIPSDKQTAVFLTCCGPETYSLLRGLLPPSRPAQAGLTEIFTPLGKHYAPRLSEVVASFKFFSRHRKEGETLLLASHADSSSVPIGRINLASATEVPRGSCGGPCVSVPLSTSDALTVLTSWPTPACFACRFASCRDRLSDDLRAAVGAAGV
ncbi:hypothetical protein MRX96_018828 [Rhipicephalus microplus]